MAGSEPTGQRAITWLFFGKGICCCGSFPQRYPSMSPAIGVGVNGCIFFSLFITTMVPLPRPTTPVTHTATPVSLDLLNDATPIRNTKRLGFDDG